MPSCGYWTDGVGIGTPWGLTAGALMLAGPGVSAQQTVFNGPSADVLDGTTYAAYSFENGDSKGSATLLELGLTS